MAVGKGDLIMAVDISIIKNPAQQPGFVFHDNQVIQSKRGRYSHLAGQFGLFPERRAHRKGFFDEIQSIFQNRLGIQNPRIFSKLWDQAANAGRFSWTPGNPLTVGEFNRIERALRETLVYDGQGMQPEGRAGDAQVHEIVEFLLGRGKPSKSWVNPRNIKGILLKRDPQLLRAVREELRVVLASCCAQLPAPGDRQEPMFQAFVGNVVALLPYAYPEAGETFRIPQKLDGEWRAVSYTVDRKFALSPKWFSSPIAAFGLVSAEGPPLITFLGTTFPAGEGYVATLLSDFTPGMSVGHAPYLYGRKQIREWLEDKQDVRLYGASLGGSLTMQLARDQKEKIGQVNAYNPAGLYPWNFIGYTPPSEVNIYYQENDLVASMGVFPEGEKVNVYRVITGSRENTMKAHARAFTGAEEVALLKGDPQYENGRTSRKLLTALHILLGLALAFLPVLLAYLLYLFFAALARPALFLAAKT